MLSLFNFFNSLFIGKWFLYYFSTIIFVFLFSYALSPMYWLGIFLVAVGVLLMVGDLVYLYQHTYPLGVNRYLNQTFSLAHKNQVSIKVVNRTNRKYIIGIIDELPFQFQIRTNWYTSSLLPEKSVEYKYSLEPKERGVYQFGKIQLFLESPIHFFQRRIAVPQEQEIAVYPNIEAMKEIALLTSNQISTFQGVKKVRKLGNNQEFDHIKKYTRGDDPRTINWKASGKRAALMVNKYEDERSQPIYCLLDTGRMMYTPFYNMSLVDYSVNAILALSNLILKKHDKPGFLSFSNKIQNFVPADARPSQMQKILQVLYKEQSSTFESDYDLVYTYLKRKVKRRSMLLLFSNFSSIYSLEKKIDVLRKINKLHLLVVVFFINKEMETYAKGTIDTISESYQMTATDASLIEKKMIQKKLNQYGIKTILTYPEDLSLEVVNTYLAIKSKGSI